MPFFNLKKASEIDVDVGKNMAEEMEKIQEEVGEIEAPEMPNVDIGKIVAEEMQKIQEVVDEQVNGIQGEIKESIDSAQKAIQEVVDEMEKRIGEVQVQLTDAVNEIEELKYAMNVVQKVTGCLSTFCFCCFTIGDSDKENLLENDEEKTINKDYGTTSENEEEINSRTDYK